jgi:malate dehydrogenase (oxaloacetate-decarboxylating)
MDYSEESLALHKKHAGKFATISKIAVTSKKDLSLIYSPGVAAVSQRIYEHPNDVYEYTSKSNTVAVVSDGSAVLGLGNIGPQAALPVMEGKAALFKEFADIDAVPICLDTQDTQEIIDTVSLFANTFGGINLEDISAPRCFEIEQALKERLDIPVFHDDQHGTAIVVAAGLLNACAVTQRELSSSRIIVNGAGAAGNAICELLLHMGISDITVLDSKGVIGTHRENLPPYKQELASKTNPKNLSGSLSEVISGADIFIGVSVADALTKQDVSKMNANAIVFALANPNPEIPVEDAKAAGAAIIATGRSDYPNQVNNVLVFPGLFAGLLESRANMITDEMKVASAKAIANIISDPTPELIIPDPMNQQVVSAVKNAVQKCV